jgi:hypothetical protein
MIPTRGSLTAPKVVEQQPSVGRELWRTRLAGAVLTALTVLLLAHPGRADDVSTMDPEDARGRLDVIRLFHGHYASLLQHRLVMEHPWSRKALRGDNVIFIWFSVDDDALAERRIVIDLRDDRLIADMERYEETSDGAEISPIGPVAVDRSTRRDVRVRFAAAMLEEDVTSYRWSVTTYYRGGKMCPGYCRDVAPRGKGRGRIEHEL